MFCKLFFRLAYGVFMLEKIMETRSSAKIFVMYDIACSLVAHLKVCIYQTQGIDIYAVGQGACALIRMRLFRLCPLIHSQGAM